MGITEGLLYLGRPLRVLPGFQIKPNKILDTETPGFSWRVNKSEHIVSYSREIALLIQKDKKAYWKVGKRLYFFFSSSEEVILLCVSQTIFYWAETHSVLALAIQTMSIRQL